MKNKNMQWYPEGHFRRDPKQFWESEYELVKDGRPNGTIILTSDGLEFFRPETDQNPRIAPPNQRTQGYVRESSNEYTRPRQGYTRESSNEYTRPSQGYTRESSNEYTRPRPQHDPRDSCAEDINNEAEEFIQTEHEKFNLRANRRTWSSG